MSAQRTNTRPRAITVRNPLGNMGDVELRESVHDFHQTTSQYLTGLRPYPTENEVLDAATVWQHRNIYLNLDPTTSSNTPVRLNPAQLSALKKEAGHTFSESGMWMVVLTVSLSAFLQGFGQGSHNGANLFADLWISDSHNSNIDPARGHVDSRFAIANASVWFSGALLGCPLAAAINSLFGRRGAIFIASFLIFVTALASAIVVPPNNRHARDIRIDPNNNGWVLLSCIRLVGGVGMGIKAVSTPILAAETAVGYWRGSFILMWQLWVSFGIMASAIVNICLNRIAGEESEVLKLRLILASPGLFALILMLMVFKCPDSFRYYLNPESRHYSPERAFGALLRLRNTRIQAVRDLYLTYVGIEQEISTERTTQPSRNPEAENGPANDTVSPASQQPQSPPISEKDRGGWAWRGVEHGANVYRAFGNYVLQYIQVLTKRRLRNAVIASGIVALAQQLSGINIMAFYGGTFLVNHDSSLNEPRTPANIQEAMVYNVIFGLLNFLFCLPAIHYIDRLGRRNILLLTLPWAAVALAAAAITMGVMPDDGVRRKLFAFWLYVHTAFYSPGIGPVPFILAAESFPLAFREFGASIAIGTNFLFAGFLAWLQPLCDQAMTASGTIGMFAGFNIIALILIFFLVEETGGVPLESLGLVFNHQKKDFVQFQFFKTIPWLVRFLLFRKGGTWGERPRYVLNPRTGDMGPADGYATSHSDERRSRGSNETGE